MDNLQLEFEKEFSSHIKDNSCNGKCSICGKCCGNILGLNMFDVIRIQEYLRIYNIKPSPIRNLIGSDGNIVESCPFLGEDNKCKIYNVRPTICRKFICNARKMYAMYDDEGKLVQDEIGQVDMRKTFFTNYSH